MSAKKTKTDVPGVVKSALAFVDYLTQRKGDRGFLADLKKGRTGTTQHKAWKHLGPWCDLRKEHTRIVYQTVAASFAFNSRHKRAENPVNFGHTLLTLKARTSSSDNKEKNDSLDLRVRKLLETCSTKNRCARVLSFIRRCEKEKISIDYVELLLDLLYWNSETYPKNLKWAASYWSMKGDDDVSK